MSLNGEDKAVLRQRFCGLRDCMLPEAIEAASRAVCRHLAAWPVLRQAHTVMTYIAFRSELDLSALLVLLPDVRWVVPRITGKRMAVHAYDRGRLVRHRFGMLEPDPALQQIDPAEIAVVLIPGVAFDHSGCRLGFGGGYYDRFLPTTPALRVGVTYDSCVVEELPFSEHDQRIDWIASPSGVYPAGRS